MRQQTLSVGGSISSVMLQALPRGRYEAERVCTEYTLLLLRSRGYFWIIFHTRVVLSLGARVFAYSTVRHDFKVSKYPKSYFLAMLDGLPILTDTILQQLSRTVPAHDVFLFSKLR
jgi:hypothetical protein